MEKFSGTITNTPPPLPKDGIYTMQVRIGTPIEGVKVTDGYKVVFSDKDGYYEITTDLQGLTFSKEGYESRGINLYPTNTGVRSNKRDVVLQKSNATTNQTNDEKKTITSQKSSFHKFLMWSVGGLVVILAGVAIYKFAKKGK